MSLEYTENTLRPDSATAVEILAELLTFVGVLTAVPRYTCFGSGITISFKIGQDVRW
jgi:hypothetical protein